MALGCPCLPISSNYLDEYEALPVDSSVQKEPLLKEPRTVGASSLAVVWINTWAPC